MTQLGKMILSTLGVSSGIQRVRRVRRTALPPICCLVLLVSPSVSEAQETLVITRTIAATINLNLSNEELTLLEADPDGLILKLREQGVSCHEPRRRLSQCAWACADETTRIIGCEVRLNRLLERLFGS